MPDVETTIAEARERPRAYPTDPGADAATLAYQRSYKCAKVALGQNATGNTYIFTWQNPESNKIIIREIVVRVTTAAGAAATMNIDVVANATSNGDTIFDQLNINTTGVYSSHNVSDTGTNGNEKPHVVDENGGTNDWVTGYESANQAYSSLVGHVYIFYTEV